MVHHHVGLGRATSPCSEDRVAHYYEQLTPLKSDVPQYGAMPDAADRAVRTPTVPEYLSIRAATSRMFVRSLPRRSGAEARRTDATHHPRVHAEMVVIRRSDCRLLGTGAASHHNFRGCSVSGVRLYPPVG